MNKIVFLLVATLACANAALLTDTNDEQTALRRRFNLGHETIRMQVSALVSDIKKISSDSDYVTTADADALSEVKTILADGATGIAAGTGATKEAVAAQITAIFDDVEPKMVAHWTEDAKKNKTVSADVPKVYYSWLDPRSAPTYRAGSVEKVTGTFDSMRTTIDRILSVAEEMNALVRSNVYTQLNNSLTEVNSKLAEIVGVINEVSADSDYVTTADAEPLTTAVTDFFNIVSGILGGSNETGSEVATKIKKAFKVVRNKLQGHYFDAAAKRETTVNDAMVAASAVVDSYNAMKSQIDAILEYAPKIAAMVPASS